MRIAAAFLMGAALVGLSASSADASILERVVAVVGDQPILLSELRHRAGTRAGEDEVLRSVLDRMIDERLEEAVAVKARVVVTPEEVEAAIGHVATQTKLSVRDLFTEAHQQGLSEQDYREEVRRQVLDGKLVQLRVRHRVRVTERDARAAYERWLKELAAIDPVDLRIIVLPVPPGSSASAVKAIEATAQRIAQRAQSGTSFYNLSQQYSQAAVWGGGSRGTVPRSMLFPGIASAIRALKASGTADAFRFRSAGTDAFLVAQLQASEPPASFEAVREQMIERAAIDLTEEQRRLWLRELRRNTYVDVRL